MNLWVKTRRLFRRRLNIHRNASVPSKKTITSWVQNSRETVSVRWPGRPRTVRTPENVDRVRAAVLQSPRRSAARRQSVALQLPNTTVRHILPKDLSFHLFKVQLLQELSDSDVENRLRFSEQFRELLIDDDDDLQNNLIVTDEAHFHLSGYVNKQIIRYWAPDNPHKMHQRPFHSSKVTVCCGVASFGVVELYLFIY
jgi:hypothetical protein